MFQFIIYREPHPLSVPLVRKRKGKSGKVTLDSVKRTQRSIKDICRCNNFTHFATFTFDRQKANRYSLVECQQKLTTFMRASKYHHSPDLKYLAIPEKHKDGAIHFHVVMTGYNGKYKDSKRKTPHGDTIYNLTGWRYGYTNCTDINNPDATMEYICKYITKDMVIIPGKKRYFCSKELVRPVKTHNWPRSDIRKKINGEVPIFENQDCEIYLVKKSKKAIDYYPTYEL